jgi:hypothetical protein
VAEGLLFIHEPDNIHENPMSRCLRERGHDVLGLR